MCIVSQSAHAPEQPAEVRDAIAKTIAAAHIPAIPKPRLASGDNSGPPRWLNEPCPAWCTSDHDCQHFAADRCHSGILPQYVPLSLHDEHESYPADTWTPEAVAVLLYKRIGGELARLELYCEDWKHEVKLTQGEARRLAKVLLDGADLAEGSDR
jgi:hypothetical protein